MLTIALLATLAGFILLAVALAMGSFPLAIACIAVCVVGLILLLVDTLRSGKRGAGPDDEPLFTIRKPEGEYAPPAPLADEPGATGDSAAADRSGWSATGGDVPAGEPAPRRSDEPVVWEPEVWEPEEPVTQVLDDGTGLGSLVDTSAPPPPEADEPTGGNANDYIRSVTGAFPAVSQPFRAPAPESGGTASGAWPVSEEPVAQHAPVEDPPEPEPVAEPESGPLPAHNPYVGRRRLRDDQPSFGLGDLPAMTIVNRGGEAEPWEGTEPGEAAEPGEPAGDSPPVPGRD